MGWRQPLCSRRIGRAGSNDTINLGMIGCGKQLSRNASINGDLRLATPGEGPFRSIRQADTLMFVRMSHLLNPFLELQEFHPFFGAPFAVPSNSPGDESETEGSSPHEEGWRTSQQSKCSECARRDGQFVRR